MERRARNAFMTLMMEGGQPNADTHTHSYDTYTYEHTHTHASTMISMATFTKLSYLKTSK